MTHRCTLLSLTLTALLASLVGAGFALRDPLPVSEGPSVEARIDAPSSVHAGESVDLVLVIANHGPGAVASPMQGVLSLSVEDVSAAPAGAETRLPIAFLALSEVLAPAAAPLMLPAGEHVSTVVSLGWFAPFDRPGTYVLRGEYLGPAGMHAVGPVQVIVEAPLQRAQAPALRCAAGC